VATSAERRERRVLSDTRRQSSAKYIERRLPGQRRANQACHSELDALSDGYVYFGGSPIHPEETTLFTVIFIYSFIYLNISGKGRKPLTCR